MSSSSAPCRPTAGALRAAPSKEKVTGAESIFMATLVVSPLIKARGFSASSSSAIFSLFHTADPVAAKGDDSDSSDRSEEHTSELQSLMRISYAVFSLKKKKK